MTRTLAIEDSEGLRTIALARGKANAIDHDFAAALLAAVRDAGADPRVGAVVVTSANPKIFSGGFDLLALESADRPTFEAFIRTVEELFLELFTLPKPVVAALTGHAIAGGALIAGACDFRIAAEGPGRISLPELTLGVLVPPLCVEALRHAFGERALARLCLTGEALSFPEAAALGVVDRVVPAQALEGEARALAARLAALDGAAYAAMKGVLRAPAAERAEAARASGTAAFVSSWFSEAGRRGLAAARAKLAG